MKKNKFILLITFILALIAVYFVFNSPKGTNSNADFAINDSSNVTKIFLTDKANNKILLKKQNQGEWTVNENHLASKEMVTTLLKTMLKLDVKSPVSKASRNNVIKRIAAIGVKVEIYQKVYRIDLWGIRLFSHEKKVKTYYVGDVTMDNMGSYMLMEDSDEPFIMYIPGFRGFLNSRYSVFEGEWRDHNVFNTPFSEIKSVKLIFPSNPENSYEVENIGENAFNLKSLALGKNIDNYDTLKLLDFLSAFRNIRYEFLISDNTVHNKDSIVVTTPFHILELTDISGKKKTLKTYHKQALENDTLDMDGNRDTGIYDKDRLYASFNDGKDFALVQFYTFDNILRPLSYFLKNKEVK